jgi:hypothetical protein
MFSRYTNKMTQDETFCLQNISSILKTKCPKPPNIQTSQIPKVKAIKGPKHKTSQIQNVPRSKYLKPRNVPWYLTERMLNALDYETTFGSYNTYIYCVQYSSCEDSIFFFLCARFKQLLAKKQCSASRKLEGFRRF